MPNRPSANRAKVEGSGTGVYSYVRVNVPAALNVPAPPEALRSTGVSHFRGNALEPSTVERILGSNETSASDRKNVFVWMKLATRFRVSPGGSPPD